MTKDRLRKIAFEMEYPLNRLSRVEALLRELIENTPIERENQASIYALLLDIISRETEESLKLWTELFALVVKSDEKPPLKAT